MNIEPGILVTDRRTTADDIFEQLRLDIVKLRLAPGSKLSEADIAGQNQVCGKALCAFL